MITIERYGRRNWAVYVAGALLCVCVYRKGALAVRAALLLPRIAAPIAAAQRAMG